jgi:hypothetical protein
MCSVKKGAEPRSWIAVSNLMMMATFREERSIKPESILDQYNTESTPIMKENEQLNSSECKQILFDEMFRKISNK